MKIDDIKPKTVEELRDVIKSLTNKNLTDENLIWALCLWEAMSYSEASLKDLARLFCNGVKPIDSLDDIQDTLNYLNADMDKELDNIGSACLVRFILTDFFNELDNTNILAQVNKVITDAEDS